MKYFIDIGNSRTSWTNDFKSIHHVPSAKFSKGFSKRFSQEDNLYISCVHIKSQEKLKKSHLKVKFIAPSLISDIDLTKIDITSIGQDRLANIVASQEFLQKDKLIIDAGTCINIDYLKNRCLEGGFILANRQLQKEQLMQSIPQLKVNHNNEVSHKFGSNTKDSLNEAINQSLIAFIEKTIRVYTNDKENLLVIFCGGDKEFFYRHCQCKLEKILVDDFFLLRGIKKIFQ